MTEERLKIAVFIDFDNIEIGVKTTLNQHFDVGTVLEAIKERGEVVTKVAYGDWTRAGEYGRAMSQHAIHMVQRNLTPGGDKNGADINLALDALEMAFTHEHINTFVIVGGDSDFISLVEKLKQYDRKVLVVGGRAFTSVVMQKNCTEFLAYENLISRGRAPQRGGRSTALDLSQAMPLVKRAVKLLADREVLPQLGLLKSTLLQLDSAFSERDYGAGSFRDFVQKLANAGFVALKGNERSFHVELRDAAGDAAPAAPREAREPREPREHREHREPREARESREPREPRESREPREPREPRESREPHESHESHESREPAPSADVVAAESGPAPVAEAPVDEQDAQGSAGPIPSAGESLRNRQNEGYQLLETAVLRPGVVSRWPLYVRQVKQLLRQVDDQFDERRYGFSGLVDLLRFGQREGLLRLDRDRMGVVRVYPGQRFPKPAGPQGSEAGAAGVEDGPLAVDTDVAAGTDAAPSLFDEQPARDAAAVDAGTGPLDDGLTADTSAGESTPVDDARVGELAPFEGEKQAGAPTPADEETPAGAAPARGRRRPQKARGPSRARKTTGGEKDKKPTGARGRAPRGRRKPGSTE